MPIIFALLLNEVENTRFRKIVQSVTSFPNFLSWVIIGGLMTNLFSPSIGMINKLIGLFGIQPIDFMNSQNWFVPIVVSSYVWRYFGWSAILYIAALAGIDSQQYEAAEMDGASRFKKVLHVSIPGIMPTMTVIFLLHLGYVITNPDWQQVLVLMGNNAVLYDVGDVIQTYVYRAGMQQMAYSFATAVNLFVGVIGFGLVFGADHLAKKLGHSGIW